MKETKAILIIRALASEEFKNFGKFVESPYFNSSKNVIKLYNILKKYYPEFDSKAIEVKNIYKKIFPGEKYHDGKMRNLISETGLLAENFLSHEYYRADEFKMEEAKIYQFRNRKLDSFYEKTIDKVLKKNKEINSMYKENYSSLINLYDLKIKDATDKMKLNKSPEDISRQAEYIALSFLYRAFNAKENIMVNRHNFNVNYPDVSAVIFDSINFEKVLAYVKENSKEIYPVLSLTYYAHKVFMFENLDENLMMFEKIYAEIKSKLDKKFHYNVLCSVINASLYKLNHIKEKEEWDLCIKKLFETYKFIDKEDLFPKEEIFDAGDFKIIADTAVFAGNQEWSLMFIEKYKYLLRDEVREDTVNHTSAGLYLKIGNFEKALYHYNKVKKPDYMTLWQLKTGLGICHYELQNFETVLSLCDSTSVELKRKYKNYDGHALQMEFFVRLRKLTKLRLDYSKENLVDFEVFLAASIEKYGEAFFFESQLKEMKKLFGKKKM